MQQWDCHNGRFEVETPQWRQGTSEIQNLAAGQWNLDTAQGAVQQWDCHNGRFEVETPQWRQGTSEMQTGTVTMEDLKWKPRSGGREPLKCKPRGWTMEP